MWEADCKDHCQHCAVPVTRHTFGVGRNSAHVPGSLAKRSSTMIGHRRAIKNFKPSDMPFSRDFYLQQVLPALAKVPKAHIRKALGVSEPWSIHIQRGSAVPHARHWKALA